MSPKQQQNPVNSITRLLNIRSELAFKTIVELDENMMCKIELGRINNDAAEQVCIMISESFRAYRMSADVQELWNTLRTLCDKHDVKFDF